MNYGRYDRFLSEELPILDLHGFHPGIIETEVDSFLKECVLLGEERAVIVHGKGMEN